MRDRINNKYLIATAFSVILLFLFYIIFNQFEVLSEDKDVSEVEAVQSISKDEFSVVDRRGVILDDTFVDQGMEPLLSEIKSANTLKGKDVELSIDSELQSYIYYALDKIATDAGYIGGAGVIMDVSTGEVLAMASYPEDEENSESSINRVTSGLYVPGSVIKPFVAIAALSEELISPEKEILSTGSIELPNPHRGGEFLVYNDWKAHGYVDMRKALGVSSNVYFYAIGGGYEGQRGLGIEKIEEYLRLFGLASKTKIEHLEESAGIIPNPVWKEEKYNGDTWRLGDTYLASIGQHGYEITPLQMVRAVASIANDGQLVTPSILSKVQFDKESVTLPIKVEDFEVVKEGMEYAVINGTAAGLYIDGLNIAAKTGTAEADSEKKHINSWIVGYFPSNKPKYAFTFFLEKGPWGEEVGSVAVATDVLIWMRDNRSEYMTQF